MGLIWFQHKPKLWWRLGGDETRFHVVLLTWPSKDVLKLVTLLLLPLQWYRSAPSCPADTVLRADSGPQAKWTSTPLTDLQRQQHLFFPHENVWFLGWCSDFISGPKYRLEASLNLKLWMIGLKFTPLPTAHILISTNEDSCVKIIKRNWVYWAL